MIAQTDSTSTPADVLDALRRLLHIIRPAPAELRQAVQQDPADPGGSTAIDAVTGWLYEHWYTEGDAQRSAAAFPGRADLASALSVTIASSRQWDTGWITVQSSPNGDCIANKRNVSRRVLPGQYANIARPGIAPQPGDGLAVIELLDWVDEQTGFWHMQSRAGEPAHPLLRVYWNVDWPHAGYLLERVTDALDAQGVRYALKCPFRSMDFRRVDTVVVYIERAMWGDAEPAVVQAANSAQHWLRQATPPLTRTIGPGVAWSEDPGGASSFGQSRCRALAPAVRSLVHDTAEWSDETGLQALVRSLQDASIDPCQPWLAAST